MLPAAWLRRFRGGLGSEVPLGPRTTWGIGGPAEVLLEPASVEQLHDAIDQLRAIGMPWRLLGGGSNLLVSDGGVRGAVLSLRRIDSVRRDGETILADAGAHLHEVVRFAAEQGLSGAEKLAGIPGTVGGALFGNAGGRHGDIGSITTRIEMIDGEGRPISMAPPPGFFRYRASDVGSRIVLRAALALVPAEPDLVRDRSLSIIHERRRTQPGWRGNAGCVFKNPPGQSAGRLIDLAGCKGMREGGIAVSATHANFFENAGDGRCDDVDRLIDRVRDRVRQAHGIDLEEEVRRWA
jgi:UDP-N-acetylmuramate dehydrogenase